MAKDRNVPDTNIDLVIKGEHHARNFALEELVNRKSKEGIKDLKAEVIRLKSLLKNQANNEEIMLQIQALLVLQNGLKYKNSL
jgi:phosphoribosylaminoimidazole-succinocarboxamide synthase